VRKFTSAVSVYLSYHPAGLLRFSVRESRLESGRSF